MSSCSKGARGLSVLPRVGGIFTSTTISLDPLLRQLPSRYAIHAGRYLTDKEFRYLRTVIVTAAVYRGFNQELRLTVTPSFNLPAPGRRHTIYILLRVSIVLCLINSREGLFVATSQAPLARSFTQVGTPYTEDTVLVCRVP